MQIGIRSGRRVSLRSKEKHLLLSDGVHFVYSLTYGGALHDLSFAAACAFREGSGEAPFSERRPPRRSPGVPPSFLAFGLDSEGFFHPGRARNSHRRSLSGAAAAGILCFLVAFDMKLKKGGVE